MQAPRNLLSGRYRCVRAYPLPDGACWWVAIDGDTGQHVAAAVVGQRDLLRLEAAKGEKHIHLAAITDLILKPDPAAIPGGTLPNGAGVAIAELVPGQTLQGQLQRGRIHPFKAVAWLMRLIDAVQRLHGSRTAHGAISPYTIVVEPVGRAIAPVLGSLVAPPIAAYASPERLSGGGPSPDDDLWALHTVLYSALTGTVPFEGGAQSLLQRVRRGKPRPLADHGINEPLLQRILDRGLAPDERQRVTELEALSMALDAWERGREPEPPKPKPPRAVRSSPPAVVETLAFDVTSLSGVDAVPLPELASDAQAAPAPAVTTAAAQPPGPPLGTDPQAFMTPYAPPVVAPATAPAVRGSPSAPPPRPATRRRSVLLLIIGILVLVGVIGGGLMVVLRQTPAPKVVDLAPTSPSSHTRPKPSASAKPVLSPKEKRAACVQSYFEEDALKSEADLDFVCGHEPFPEVSTRLFGLAAPRPTPVASALSPVPSADAPGIVVTGTSNMYDLGWYELPATTIIRANCCPNAAPISLPTTPGWCDQLQGQIRVLTEASRKPVDLSSYGRKFEDAVQCFESTGTKHGYMYRGVPTETQRRNFQRFLKYAAESDTKRARMDWLR
ncbi:MAG: hypothetical protein JW751_21970 [Polyangiaceae bacterium]|nr:hypothetical protein [Polyangiaceae bacterium]